MSPLSRRIFAYWMLLLVPALAVGVGALALVRREQQRIDAQRSDAVAAREAALEARARLVAESVELLLGDVEAGVTEALAAAPAEGGGDWPDGQAMRNPLVKTFFRVGANGAILRPRPEEGEEAAGFVRRFAAYFRERAPWHPAVEPTRPKNEARPAAPAAATGQDTEVRRKVAANVLPVQSARRDVQELFKSQESAYARAPRAGAAAVPPMATAEVVQAKDAAAGAISVGRAENRPPALEAFAAGVTAASAADSAEGKSTERTAASPLRQAPSVGEELRRGWTPVTLDGRWHFLAWVRFGGTGEVRGAELDPGELLGRLRAALPVEAGPGEGYALRDRTGRIWHRVGELGAEPTPRVRVPLAEAVFPGWEVVAFLANATGGGGGGSGFAWIAGAVVAVSLLAILAGGALLGAQARRSAEEAELKTSFVANVSHEFKTPLTTIRLYAELLEQGRVRDAEKGREYLQTIGRETQRLARLVNNALDFSRLEQGRKTFACEDLDLGVEAARLAATQQLRLAEAGLRLEWTPPAGPVPVRADRDACEQIVLNLLDNAAKYAAAGGEVALTVRPRPAGGAELRVADRGPGVPAAHRERIFEKFHRVDETLTAEKTGAGLGLSIARQLARGMGGELRYEPRPGGGSEFVLELS